jgi:hypothetical protein
MGKTLFISLHILLVSVSRMFGQEVLYQAPKPIRAFAISGDTLVYSQESQINILINNKLRYSYFGGGHILELSITENLEIESLANKYKEQIGSIRSFSLSKKSLTKVLKFNNSSPILDYTNSTRIFVSFNNGFVEIYERNNSVDFVKTLGNFGLVREIKIIKDKVFFCSDDGEMYMYFNDGIDNLFSLTDSQKILGFSFLNGEIIAYSNTGNLIRFNTTNLTYNICHIIDTIITDMVIIEDRYAIVGDWEGNISTFDLSNNRIINKFQAHKGQIIRLKKYAGYKYISSGSDGKIIGWENLLR